MHNCVFSPMVNLSSYAGGLSTSLKMLEANPFFSVAITIADIGCSIGARTTQQ